MTITGLSVRNFKSFEKLDFELGDFNVVVGANASGKSNLVSIFHFLRTIPQLGLRDAILTNGGGSLFRRMGAGDEDVRFSVSCTQPLVSNRELMDGKTRNVGARRSRSAMKATYAFALHVGRRAGYVKVREDILTLKFEQSVDSVTGSHDTSEAGSPTIVVSHEEGKMQIDIRSPERLPSTIIPLKPIFDAIPRIPMRDSMLLLENPLLQPLFVNPFQDLLSSSIFSISPERARMMNVDVGKPVLDMTAANLSLVLGRLLDTPQKRSRFMRLIHDLLPMVADIKPARFANYVVFKVREAHSKQEYVPAEALSDGTLSTIALLVALYFEPKPLLIIEEPERNLHPRLLAQIAEAMKDVSKERQLIVTTHSPSFVEAAGLENLLLLSRDASGRSVLTRPRDRKEVTTFLAEDIGLGSLFAQGLLSP
jgi:predicted ATPase